MRWSAIVLTAALLAGCNSSKPSPLPLAGTDGAPYRVWLRTYQDGEYADQPFELLVRAKSGKITATILRAQQCENVSVAQTIDTIYVFYSHLLLTEFSSSQFSHDQPHVRLCNLHFADCANAQRHFARSKASLSNVCTNRTKLVG